MLGQYGPGRLAKSLELSGRRQRVSCNWGGYERIAVVDTVGSVAEFIKKMMIYF